MHIFRDRTEAGKMLANVLLPYQQEDLLILALPRGGVPVAYEIAEVLHAPLDVIIVRKLGVPGQEELAMGAIGMDGTVVLNEEVIHKLDIQQNFIEQAIYKGRQEVDAQNQIFRGRRPFPNLKGKMVILVDDGLATGSTALAAIKLVKDKHPHKLVLAVPVGASDTIEYLSSKVDKIVCIEEPTPFSSVGFWYKDFQQVTTVDAVEMLQQVWQQFDVFVETSN